MKHATTLKRPRTRGPSRPLWTARLLFDGQRVLREGPRVLSPGRLVLGRAPEGGWELPEDPLLSREHLALEAHGEALTATDLGSSNGSSLNGEPLERAALKSGDVLRLGDTFLLVRQVRPDLRPAPARGAVAGLVGDAPEMHRLRRELSLVGARETAVLLLGESGTGKGVCAEALHRLSGRSGPLVSVNCAAIPAQLAESTLFGHAKGAFTGASEAHDGFFRRASGGTLFLDEVADLPPALQPKLLHAVEAGEVTPVGASRPVPVDVRILTATSTDLDKAIEAGAFRGELYARLAEFILRLPPLRERVEDVLPLLSRSLEAPLSPELVEQLLLYGWPYNVRDLEKLSAELAVRGQDHERLEPELLAGRLQLTPTPPQAPTPAPGPQERETIEAALRDSGGQITAAAAALGRSRRQLYRDLERLGIDPGDFRG